VRACVQIFTKTKHTSSGDLIKHTSVPKYTAACEHRESKDLSNINLIKILVCDEHRHNTKHGTVIQII
jgi:hypothetical protein